MALARAFISDFGSGAQPPPPLPPPPASVLPWHEPFDQADYAALQAQYSTLRADAFLLSGGFSVTGGYLQIVGTGGGVGAPDEIDFGPAPFTASYPEWWARVQLEMVGGAYDSTSCPVQWYIYRNAGGLEHDLDGFGGLGGDRWEEYLWPDATQIESTVSKNFAAGTHTIIACMSEDSAGVWRGEVWVDSAPGSPAVAVGTSSKTPGQGIDNVFMQLRGPIDPARSVRFLDISVIAGNRASDPFGIL